MKTGDCEEATGGQKGPLEASHQHDARNRRHHAENLRLRGGNRISRLRSRGVPPAKCQKPKVPPGEQEVERRVTLRVIDVTETGRDHPAFHGVEVNTDVTIDTRFHNLII
ncbi:Hypp4942 [Branchiostoma lanceolatum]|uniref:Hypp4942 protein n=1 Tax=Branchiostoma lanceolatum TaxID=7740 RepID=A0A8K0ACG0_BRALA|nr:Hypp4942 [Branchiostoma lanceolatum]